MEAGRHIKESFKVMRDYGIQPSATHEANADLKADLRLTVPLLLPLLFIPLRCATRMSRGVTPASWS